MALTNAEQTLIREVKRELGESIPELAETPFDPAVDSRAYFKSVLQAVRPVIVARRNKAQAEADRLTTGLSILDGLIAKFP